MLRWHAVRAALIGFDPAGVDPERGGEVVHPEPQGAALASDTPADMLIDRRHASFSSIALVYRYSTVTAPAPAS